VRTDVLIVGAGPAGLVLAAVLADHGVASRIVDRKAGPVDESRAAIVHVRTLELLDRLGLADRAVARGVRTTRVEVWERGRRLGVIPLDGRGDVTPFPFALALEQDRTERLLVEHLTASGVRVEWHTELVSLTPDADGATAVVRGEDGSQETVEARWVVGADGARSAVRHAVGVGFAGDTYGQTGLLADVEMETAAGGPAAGEADPAGGAGAIRLNLTAGGFVGTLRLGNGRHRLFGAVPATLTATPSSAEVSHEAYAEVPLADIQRWFDEYFVIDARLRSAAWTALFRIHSRVADRFRVGAVFLVGDAAHIHSPAGGQGMNLAIGDAFNLGWKLALVARGQARSALLDSYEAERRPVALAVLRGTDRGFALEVTANPVLVWIRGHVAGRLIGPLTRLPFARDAIFRLFSQTWIAYGRSPAVASAFRARGGPKAGDRAPYGQFESMKGGIYGLIGGTRHHLLVFPGPLGDVGPPLDALERLVASYQIEVAVHVVPTTARDLHARYGARSPRMFLIRPDGHIGYIGSPGQLSLFEAYLNRWFSRRQDA
jgi:2-polyprenyl-6-methoxyphenol hydroxylase-like FAD-dependent oxidoreductase